MSDDRDQGSKESQLDDVEGAKPEEKWEDPVLPPDDFSDAGHQEQDAGDDEGQEAEGKKGKTGLLAFALLGLVGIGGAGFAYMHFGRSDQQLSAASVAPAGMGSQLPTAAASIETAANEPQKPDSVIAPVQASGAVQAVDQIVALPTPSVSPPQMPDMPAGDVVPGQLPVVNNPTVVLEGAPKLPETAAVVQQEVPVALPSTLHAQGSGQVQQPGTGVSLTQPVPTNESMSDTPSAGAAPQLSVHPIEPVPSVPGGEAVERGGVAQSAHGLSEVPVPPAQALQTGNTLTDNAAAKETAPRQVDQNGVPEVKPTLSPVATGMALASTVDEASHGQTGTLTKQGIPPAEKALVQMDEAVQSKSAQSPRSGKKISGSHHADAGKKAKVKDAKKVIYKLRSAMPDEAWLSVAGSEDIQHVRVGDSLPGLGRIQSITLQGENWVVKGVNASVK